MNQESLEHEVLNLTRNRVRNVFPVITREFLTFNIKPTATKYKIAICISGGLRHFEQTQEWMNKFLIDPLNADTFFFGWSNKSGKIANEDQIKNFNNLKSYTINDIQETKLDVSEALKQKFLHAEEGCTQRCQTILGQFYNIYNCFELLKQYEYEQQMQYDIVIRARPDAFFFSKITDAEIEAAYNSLDSISVPQNYLSIYCGMLTDMFAMGTRHNMEAYSKVFLNLEEYGTIAPAGTGAEFFIHHHVYNKYNLRVQNIDMPFMLDFPSDYGPGGEANKHHRHVYQNDAPKG